MTDECLCEIDYQVYCGKPMGHGGEHEEQVMVYAAEVNTLASALQRVHELAGTALGVPPLTPRVFVTPFHRETLQRAAELLCDVADGWQNLSWGILGPWLVWDDQRGDRLCNEARAVAGSLRNLLAEVKP